MRNPLVVLLSCLAASIVARLSNVYAESSFPRFQWLKPIAVLVDLRNMARSQRRIPQLALPTFRHKPRKQAQFAVPTRPAICEVRFG